MNKPIPEFQNNNDRKKAVLIILVSFFTILIIDSILGNYLKNKQQENISFYEQLVSEETTEEIVEAQETDNVLETIKEISFILNPSINISMSQFAMNLADFISEGSEEFEELSISSSLIFNEYRNEFIDRYAKYYIQTHTYNELIKSPEDLMVLVRIIDNEAGSSSSETERSCVAATVLNRCRYSDLGIRDCIARQISQWSPDFLSNEYFVKHEISYYAAVMALFETPQQCSRVTHYFSPISMARANSESVAPEECVSYMEAGDRRHSFYNPKNQRFYLCDSREGFLYYYSSRGGTRNFPGLGERVIPGFANSPRVHCYWNGLTGVNPNRFIFCHRI